jgi:hypothetical protein
LERFVADLTEIKLGMAAAAKSMLAIGNFAVSIPSAVVLTANGRVRK